MSDSPGGIADILERVAAEDPAAPVVEEPKQPEAPEDDAAATADKLRRDLAAQTTRAQNAERARAEAENNAAAARTEAQATRQSAVDANYTTILSALDARNREMESVTAGIAAAGEAGDFRKIAELSAQAGRLGASIEGLENARQEMERQRQERLREPPKPAPRQQQQADPTTTVGVSREVFLTSNNLAPHVADWIRNHDQFFTDQVFHHKCVAADALLRADGILPTDPSYLSRVEGIIGLSQAAKPAAAPARQSNAPPSAAPPSRATPSLGGRAPASNGDVYISPEDRKLADWMGIDAEGMVAERERLKAAGELPHRRR